MLLSSECGCESRDALSKLVANANSQTFYDAVCATQSSTENGTFVDAVDKDSISSNGTFYQGILHANANPDFRVVNWRKLKAELTTAIEQAVKDTHSTTYDIKQPCHTHVTEAIVANLTGIESSATAVSVRTAIIDAIERLHVLPQHRLVASCEQQVLNTVKNARAAAVSVQTNDVNDNLGPRAAAPAH